MECKYSEYPPVSLPTVNVIHNIRRRKSGTKADWATLVGSWPYVAIGARQASKMFGVEVHPPKP